MLQLQVSQLTTRRLLCVVVVTPHLPLRGGITTDIPNPAFRISQDDSRLKVVVSVGTNSSHAISRGVISR